MEKKQAGRCQKGQEVLRKGGRKGPLSREGRGSRKGEPYGKGGERSLIQQGGKPIILGEGKEKEERKNMGHPLRGGRGIGIGIMGILRLDCGRGKRKKKKERDFAWGDSGGRRGFFVKWKWDAVGKKGREKDGGNFATGLGL